MIYEDDVISISKGLVRIGNRKTNRDHPNYSNVENGENTEKSAADIRRLTVTQTPVKDRQLTVVSKTPKEYPNKQILQTVVKGV